MSASTRGLSNSFQVRLKRGFLFRAQAIFFGRLVICGLYCALFILALANPSIGFPHQAHDALIILLCSFYAYFCYRIKNHAQLGRWCHFVTLIIDLFIHIYFTKYSGFILSPLMALHPLFTAMFLLLFHNPFIIAAPLLSVPIVTLFTLMGPVSPHFVLILSTVLLFCTLDALTIFFIHLVQSQEQRLMNTLIAVEKKLRALAISKERQRFARDFHDGIGAQLTSVIMQVDYLQLGLSPKEALYMELSEIRAGALSSIDDMRRSIAFLRDDFDVAEQVALLCENMRERHRMDIKTQGIYHLAGLSPEQQIACCRVVQESLMNVMKHAQASLTIVRCLRDHGLIRLTIEDNGRGFDPETNHRHHYGLSNMADRARQIGGAFAIVSEAQCGTQVELSIPC